MVEQVDKVLNASPFPLYKDVLLQTPDWTTKVCLKEKCPSCKQINLSNPISWEIKSKPNYIKSYSSKVCFPNVWVDMANQHLNDVASYLSTKAHLLEMDIYKMAKQIIDSTQVYLTIIINK